MKRPTSVTVFAVLNLVFGFLGICCIPFSAILILFPEILPQNPDMPNYTAELMQQNAVYAIFTKASLGLGFVASIVLAIAGFGLLGLKSWGRKISIGYAAYTILMAIAGIVVHASLLPQAAELDGPQQAGVMITGLSGIAGGCIGFIYPILLLYFMTRPNVVAAFGEPMEEKLI